MEIHDIFKRRTTAPFLFLGAGFTRHYYNTPDWKGILEIFASRPFNYYLSNNERNYPRIAEIIAEELNEKFWDDPILEEDRKIYENEVTTKSSYMKIKVSNYLRDICIKKGLPDGWKEELDLLRNAQIDGVITTNWDDLVEQVFPKFKKYVGQEELLFNTSFSIGEIYKIHGCMSKPNTLVLTSSDYENYNAKYAYLAAKLLTIFVEHPVIFIGYSLTDENINLIIRSLIECLSQENINKLKNNLIFVEWKNDPNYEMTVETIQMGEGGRIPCIKISTHDFKPIYRELGNFKRKIPSNVLRLYKKNFYEVVCNERPEQRLYAISEKDLEGRIDIDFVCGFGAISKYNSNIGYRGLKAYDLFSDLLVEDKNFNPASLLTTTIPNLQGNLPMYKYLKALGINSDADYKNNGLGINARLNKLSDLMSTSSNTYSLVDIISGNDLDKTVRKLLELNFYEIGDSDLEILRNFLAEHINDFLVRKNSYSTQFRKLACIYDLKKYGW